MLQLTKVKLFEPRERFLIFSVGPEGANRVLVGVDEDKKMHWEKLRDRLNQQKFLNKFTSADTTSVISLHPSLGTVRIVPFKYSREAAGAPLSLTELENFLAQHVQKTFLDLRAGVAAELDTDILDTIILETRPFAYVADKSAVESPLGHRVREVNGLLEMLFTTRKAFDLLQPVLYSGNPAYLTLRDKSELAVLQKMGKPPVSFLAFDSAGGARLLEYNPAKKEIFKRVPIDWSPFRFLSRLEELWNVDRLTAKAAYGNYLREDLSPKLKGQLEKVMKSEVRALFAGLKKAGARGRVYVKTPFTLPVSFPVRQSGIILEALPFSNIFSKLGFKFDKHLEALPKLASFTQLAPLIECYYDNSDAEVIRSLRRRIHWLIS